MSIPTQASSPAEAEFAGYRLRGQVGGRLVSFAFSRGQFAVGCSGENDLRLTEEGVSRRHALLRVEEEGVFLEDLGSRNGSTVNGRGVPPGGVPIRVGDELSLGPARLRLEGIHPEDVDLGLAMAPSLEGGGSEEPSRSVLSRETAPMAASGALDVLGAMLRHLAVKPQADIAGALRSLGRGLGADGVAWIRWPRGAGPVVSEAVGEIGAVPARSALRGARRSPLDGDLRILPGEAGPGSFGIVSHPRGREAAGLLLWGAGLEGKDPEPLAVAGFRIFQLLEPRSGSALAVEASPSEAAPELPRRDLVFPEGILPGEAPSMVSLYQQMLPLVEGELPVVIEGETGVGKEHIARVLHLSSGRKDSPFVAINCAAIPAELLEAELFGIAQGVATGVKARRGLFQEAEGGTLFLDEVGDMPLELQAKLLRALQEKEIQPLGRSPVAIDVRIVAATNTDLQGRLQDGRFRQDLYYRIAGYRLEVPPLRQRREDLPRLLGHFLRIFAGESRKTLRGVTVRALRALTAYGWPGNVRELEHVARRLAYLCPKGQAIDSAMIPQQILRAPLAKETPETDEEAGLEDRLARVEGRLIREALSRTAGNQSRAARLLGVSRNGLAKRLKRLGIRASDFEAG